MFGRAREEEGFAMITAIGVSFVMLLFTLFTVQLSMHNLDSSANERRRTNAIDAAESGIYYYLSYLQSTGGVQPACRVTQTLTGSPTETFTVTPTFYNGSGTPYTCPAGGNLGAGIIPASVLVHSKGTVGTLAYPVRAMEAFATLTVTQGTSFGVSGAIFGQNQVSFQANAQIGGSQYADADIYTNGSLSLQANSTLYGNIFAQGAVTLQANSEVKKTVWANGSITLGGNARIRGNAIAAPAGATISMNGQSTIYGDATAGSTISGGNVLGRNSPNSPSSAPPVRAYPVFTYTATDWSGASPAYTIHPYTNNCAQPLTDLGNWFGAAAGTFHVIRITGGCALNINASKTIKGNLAIITDGAVSLSNNVSLTQSGGPWNLYMMACLAQGTGCSYSDGNNSSIANGLNTLLYVPANCGGGSSYCAVNLSNNSSLSQGQIIGGNLSFKHSATLQYQQVAVPSGGGGGFKEDVTYIREVIAP